MPVDAHFLSTVPLIQRLPHDALALLAQHAQMVRLAPGERAWPGGNGPAVDIVQEGLLALSVAIDGAGGKPVLVAIVGPGRFLNLERLVTETRPLCSAQTIMAATVVRVPVAVLATALHSDPTLERAALRQLAAEQQKRMATLVDALAMGRQQIVTAVETCPALLSGRLTVWNAPGKKLFWGRCAGCDADQGRGICPLAGLAGNTPHRIEARDARVPSPS